MATSIKNFFLLSVCAGLLNIGVTSSALGSDYAFRAMVQNAWSSDASPAATRFHSGDQLSGQFSYNADAALSPFFQPVPDSGFAAIYDTGFSMSFTNLQTGFSYDSRLPGAFSTGNRTSAYVENDVVPVSGPVFTNPSGNPIGADSFNLLFDKEAHDFSESGTLSFTDLTGKAMDMHDAGGVLLPGAYMPQNLTLARFDTASFYFGSSNQFNNQIYGFNAGLIALTPLASASVAVQTAPIPEPQTYLMMLVGLLMLAGVRFSKTLSHNENQMLNI